MKKYPLVVVTWHDACSTDPWTGVDELEPSPLVCTTVGFLISKARAAWLAVASTISDDGDACCVMHIPAGCVISIKKVQWKGET
jgi:hypothetical protein